MNPHDAPYDAASVGVTAIVAVIAVVTLVINLAPGATGLSLPDLPLDKNGAANAAGKAVEYRDGCVAVGLQFDAALFDFNKDGLLDYYDYADVLSGKVDCNAGRCDLNADGVIDDADAQAFNLLIVRLYDYDGDRRLTRDDPHYLRDLLLGKASCDADHVCDVDGDGFVCASDLTLYTSFVYNSENPV